ncbi:peroxisomal assembly protein [Chamberlinius hualienensis]
MAASNWRPCNIVVSKQLKLRNFHPLYLNISQRNAALFDVHENQKIFIGCLRWSWLETEGHRTEGNLNSTDLLVTVKVSTTSKKEVDVGNNNIILYATDIFIRHYGLNSSAQVTGFRIRAVESVVLTNVVFYAQTPACYEYLVNESYWKMKLMIKSCQQSVLCRKSDVCLSPLGDKEEEAVKELECLFDLHTLDCQPVNQGVIGPDTTVTILETGCKKSIDYTHKETIHYIVDDTYESRLFSSMVNLIAVGDFALNLLAPFLFRDNKIKTMKQIIKQVTLMNKLGTRWKINLDIKILTKHPNESNIDWESTVFVTSNWLCKYNLKDLCWVKVWLDRAENKKRLVRLCAVDYHKTELNSVLFDHLNDFTALVTPQLWFNLNDHPSKFVQTQTSLYLQPTASDLMSSKFAEEIHISSLNPLSKNCSHDEELKKYFTIPRLVSKGDVICVPVIDKDVLDESGEISCAFFTVKKLVPDIHSILVDNQQSSLYLEGSTFGYVPKIVSSYFSYRLDSIWDSWSPCGLEKYSEKISNIILPYLHSSRLRKDGITAIFLYGPSGSGKMTIMNAVSRMLNINILVVDCWDVVGEALSATEVRLKTSILKAVGIAPCLLVFKNVHVLLNNFDGITGDPPLIFKLQDMLLELRLWTHPLVVIGLTNSSTAVNSTLGNLFLHHVKVEVPNKTERLHLLNALLDHANVGLDVSIENLVKNTSGFVLGDLVGLISRASQASYQRLHQMGNEEDICLAGVQVMACDFDVAFSDILAAQSDAMGAPTIPQVKWEDVGGLEDIKLELINSVKLPLENPELIAAGMRRSGVLLYGPPGTGKTLLAKAVATEFSLNFISVKGPELLSMYVGQSEENVRKVFQRARDASPVVVFFDEMDSLAPNRGRSGDSGGVMDRVVSQLLAEIDGLSKAADIFVMAATNRPDLIDPALLRPGRFDKLLYVGVSEDRSSQLKILKALTRKFKLGFDVDFDTIIEMCPSCLTGADFYALCSDALLAAVSRRVKNLDEGLLDEDVDNDTLVVSQEDFISAVSNLVPSVSTEILQSYSKLSAKMS